MKKFAFIFSLSLCFCGLGLLACTDQKTENDEKPPAELPKPADGPKDIVKIPAYPAYIEQMEPGDEYSYVGFGFEHAGAHLKNRPKIIDGDEFVFTPAVTEKQKIQIKNLSQATEQIEIAPDINLPVYRLDDASKWQGNAPAAEIAGDTMTLKNAPGVAPAA
jgi:hypothetical protein